MSRSTSAPPKNTPGGRRSGRRWDAVIVGARVAGGSTALLLARAGLRVLVVDRARRGSDTLSTHALMRGGVLQLRRWGLLDRVIASGAPAVRRVTFHYGPELMPISLKPYAGVDALYSPRRTVLDSLLVDAAEAAGAEFRFGVTMADLVRDGAGRVVGVLLRDHRGRSWIEMAPLVVGADGRGSLLANRVKAPIIATGAYTGAYLYGYWPAPDLDGYHWYYGGGLSAGAIPTNDGFACVFVGGPPATVAAAMDYRGPAAGHRQLVSRVDADLAELTAPAPEDPVRLFRGLPARLHAGYGDGWALVGDAGWWKDPLSTHGMTDALRDAELLTMAVVTGAGSASEHQARLALADYQAQRDTIALPMHPIVDRLASHRWDLTEARWLLRGLSSVMTDEVDAMSGFDAAPARRTA